MDKILRMAASRVGYSMDRISDPNDPAHQLVSENFATVVRTELENYPWHWSDSERSFPCYAPEENECQYQGVIRVSEDIVRIRKVHQCGRDIRYDRHGDRLLLWNLDKGQSVTVRGQWYNDVGSWPENFKEIIVCRFAGMIGSSLTQRPDLGQYFDTRADLYAERAKSADSLQQTNQRIITGRIAARRRTPYTSPTPPSGPAGGGTSSTGGGGTSPGTGGGIEEAPIDGNRYGRKNQTWEADPVQSDAPSDTQEYVRKDGGWVVNTGGSGGVPEAPNDGQHKLRRTLSGVSTWENAGGAALLNVGSGAGDVAAGNAPALAVASHEADANPHGQYPLTSTLGNASIRDVGTGAGDVAQGDAPAAAVSAHEAAFDHEKVKVTDNDTQAQALRDQVQSGDASIVFSVVNPGGNEILDMRATGAGGGEANENQNVGTGEGLIARDKTGVFNNVRSIKTTASITVATVGDEIQLTGIENPTNDGNNYARSTSVGGSSTWVQLGDSALRNVGAGAGEVAAGNAPAAQVAVHEAAGNPHSQYPLSSSLGDAATKNVGTGAGDVAAGDAPAAAVSAHEGAGNPHSQYALSASLSLVATSGLHADLTDRLTNGHPGSIITIAAGVQGNAVSIAADGSLEDSGTPPGGVGTNLGNTPTATTVQVESSTGGNTIIAGATNTVAGVATAAQITQLEGTDAAGTARPPTAHSSTHSTGQADEILPANIGAATASQGALADTAVQPGDDAAVLGSGAATNLQVLTADGAGNASWVTGGGGGWVDGTTVTDWGLGVQALGSLGAGTSAVDLDNGHHITATLTADRTFNFSSTAGHAVTQWTATISTGGNTPTFQFNGVAVDLPADYDISGSPQRIHFTFIRDAFGVSVLERKIP